MAKIVHQTGRDGSGHYFTKIEEGKVLELEGGVAIVRTLQGKVYWKPDEGPELLAWAGAHWRAEISKERARKKAQAEVNMTLGRLRSYYDRTGRRWEVEREEERKAKRDAEIAASRARARLREAAPRLRAALKALTEHCVAAGWCEGDRALAILEAQAALEEAEHGKPASAPAAA